MLHVIVRISTLNLTIMSNGRDCCICFTRLITFAIAELVHIALLQVFSTCCFHGWLSCALFRHKFEVKNVLGFYFIYNERFDIFALLDQRNIFMGHLYFRSASYPLFIQVQGEIAIIRKERMSPIEKIMVNSFKTLGLNQWV